MRQGLLAITLLLNAVLWSPLTFSLDITQEDVDLLLTDSQVLHSTNAIYQDVLFDNADSVRNTLAQTPLPEQEVIRFLLLKKIESQRLVLTPRMAIFIKSQQQRTPIYTVFDSGDSYIASMPAFNASLIADRLIASWKQDQTTIDFIIAAENQDLDLFSWLKGNSPISKEHETLLVNEAGSLSPQALEYLVNQLVGKSLIQWVPSTPVVVKLAQLTQNQRLYSLLWKMKANKASEDEIKRLVSVGDDFSMNQLMEATQNPALKNIAINGLVQIQPMNEMVKSFLVEKLNHVDDGSIVAQALSKSSYRSWLIHLIENGRIKNSQILMQSLVVKE